MLPLSPHQAHNLVSTTNLPFWMIQRNLNGDFQYAVMWRSSFHHERNDFRKKDTISSVLQRKLQHRNIMKSIILFPKPRLKKPVREWIQIHWRTIHWSSIYALRSNGLNSFGFEKINLLCFLFQNKL